MRLDERPLASQAEDVVGCDGAMEALKNEFPHWFDFHEYDSRLEGVKKGR